MDEKWIKLERIEVPDAVWEALRDNNLVIFAGAGVSMAPPANLPSFKGLAEEMFQKIRVPILNGEREDAFFGRLKDDLKIDVHEKTREIFSEKGPKPTETHKNLLRLYPKDHKGKVRIVTTNFDLLFECAAQEVFGATVDIETFDAPALPSGKRFNGIVHVHGSVSHCDEMVLTDRDFGRAYLPEGYSCRFLVDLFNEFMVLFIGYSHEDPLMVYMARALSSSEKQCFILTCEKNLEHWKRLGITPICYEKSDAGGHDAVDKLIRRSADLVKYSILDWQREIGDIAKNPPPLLDGEEASLIKIAFGYEAKIRFFTKEAVLPDWIEWLDGQGYLDALFLGDDLNDKELELCKWLVEKFASDYSDYLFSLIGKHQMCLNLKFWRVLGRGIANRDKGLLDGEVLSKWVSVLLETIPSRAWQNRCVDVLWMLGEQCGKYESWDDLLRIFDVMSADNYVISPDGGISPVSLDDRGSLLNEIWKKNLKPNLEKVAESLLTQVVTCLKKQHFERRVWKRAGRSRNKAVNVLVDAARDCLVFMAVTEQKSAMYWCNQLVASESPLLCRLAVRAFFKIENIQVDEKIDWLLENKGLYNQPVQNEAFKAIKQVYLGANQQRRKNVVEAILAHESERKQYDWLYRLYHAVPDCEIAKKALERIQEKHLELREIEGKRAQSSWTAKRLLEKPLEEQFPDLLTFQDKPEFNRRGLVRAVQEAANSDSAWGMELAKMLDEAEKWNSNLWKGLIRAWAETRLSETSYNRVLDWLSKSELHFEHPLEIAQALRALVDNGGTPYAFNLLPRANHIAKTLWGRLDKTEKMPFNGWLSLAINHPAGVLTLFWLMSFSVWRENQESTPERMSDEYRDMLSEIVQNRTLAGKLGRTVLAGQFSFLLNADEKWAKDKILPLFGSDNDFQVAWDGFLATAHLTPDTAQVLNDVLFKAVQKIGSDLIPQKDRFVELYVIMLEGFVKDHKKWIANLFDYGDEEIRRHFVFAIDYRLRQKNSDKQREYWRHCLKGYWENRLDNIPDPLSNQESERMLNWLPLLESVFPEAVDLACRMPLNRLEDVQVLHGLKTKKGLINDYPEAIAKLMIGLGDCSMSSYVRGQVSKVIEKIPQEKISSETKQKLRELKAKIGVD